MADDKKLVKEITSMDEDFAQWYTDIVKKAELCDYASVKGCMVIKPAGYALWEAIQKDLDARFKATGVQNCYMPVFIPESLLQKEKDHVEGFAPEVAWVTHGGLEPRTMSRASRLRSHGSPTAVWSRCRSASASVRLPRLCSAIITRRMSIPTVICRSS